MSNIKKAGLLSYINLAISVVSGLIYTPWMISTIGMSDYAVYSLTMTIIGFFSIDFGLGSAVSKFLLDYINGKDSSGYRTFLTTIYRMFWLTSCVIAIGFVIFYFCLESSFSKLTLDEVIRLKSVYIIAATFALFSMLFRPLDGVLIANERFVFIKMTELCYKLGTLSAIVTLLLFDFGLYALVFVNALAGVLKILIQFVYVQRQGLNASPWSNYDSTLVRRVIGFSGWVMLATLAQRFIMLVAPMILAALSGSTAVAIFSIAMVIEAYVWMLSSALSGLFLPKVSKTLARENNTGELQALLIKVGRLQLVVISLIVIGFFLLGQEFVALWVGADYQDVYLVTLLLITHSVVVLPQEIARTALFASGEVKYYSYSVLSVALISLPISITLIPEWGSVGAAFGILIGNIIGNVLIVNYFYNKVLNIRVWSFFVECYGNMLLPMLLTGSLYFLFDAINLASSWLFFMTKVISVALIYFIGLWVFALNTYEKQLFKQLSTIITQPFSRRNNVHR